ncbi:MAG: hypothetical protein PHG89_10860 [Gallionella sp.]|nr:hypothetical protein [Gallionella sp.]
MINIRTKGQEGEREIVRQLDYIIQKVAKEHGYELNGASVQRNQNQSAVGGCDLSNTFGLAIEVKRQEQLAINTWWDQTVAQAKRNNEVPVLLFRQNRKAWRCVVNGEIPLAHESTVPARVEISWESFLAWFQIWVHQKMKLGEQART